MNETLTFNGINSGDYGVYIAGDSVYNAPERDVEMVTVPGRNGNIALDRGRFENIEVEYPAFISGTDQTDFAGNISDFRNAILSTVGYARLEDDYHPDEYRLAVYHSGLEVEPKIYNRAGAFEIRFDCKPQRFLKSGETAQSFSGSGTITNPTRFDSKPLYLVTGYGTLTVNGYAITITGTASQQIYIDCETFEAYSISGGTVTPRNDRVSIGNQSPVLSPGANTVTLAGNISNVKITPRWWTI